jgi:DNA repair protein RadC
MAKFKKGSAAAKAYMAKLRAARGKKVSGTKTPAVKYVNIFGQRVKVGSKKYQIMMQQKKQFNDIQKNEISGSIKINGLSTYNKAPAAVKKLVDSFEFTDNYNERQKIVKNLEAKGYKIEFNIDGSIESFKKIPAKKVGYKADRLKIVKVSSKLIKNYTDKGYKRKDAIEMADNEASLRIQSGKVSGYKQTPEIILGRVGAVTLLKSLAPEVKLRISRGKKVATNKISSSQDITDILKKFITPAKMQTQEYALAMFLNNNNNVLAVYQFGMGGFTSTIMDKRLLMAAALKLGATGIILAHNHPSGSLQPSKADFDITKQVINIANLHSINFIDHVILTKDGYYSFADNGVLQK